MKNFILSSMVIAAVLTIVSAPHFLKKGLKDASPTEEVKTAAVLPKREIAPDPKPTAPAVLPPKKIITPVVEKPPPPKAAAKQPPDPARAYWDRMARQFERQLQRLANETDPAKRLNLIRAMSGYVRIDTLSALDWAMSLQDPAEQQAALEAINTKALVGIGARIQVDETGYPRIRETMVMSAVTATGQVEPGDYIVGMDDGSGQPVYFEGLPTREIAQQLRGQAGSEIRLLMERTSDTGSAPRRFDINIRRSLIVVQPPL